MDDPNITMEEYIRLEEEKAQKRRKVFNWEIAKYGKIWYDEDIHDLRFVDTKFPTIAFIDEVSSEKTLSCEPTRPRAIRHMAPLPPRDQRHIWLHYHVEGYTEEIVYDFEQRLETIFGRIKDEIGLDMVGTLCFQMGGARRSMTWRQFILALGLHTTEKMAEDGFGAYWLRSERLIPDKGDLSGYWVEISSSKDFLIGAPSYTYIRDPVRSMDRGAANVPYMLAQYLFRHIEGRKSGARLLEGHFIGCLAHHFGLVSDDGLRGLSVVARLETQQVAMAGAPEAAKDAPVVVEGDQAIPAPVQARQQPPPPPLVAARTMPQRLGRLEEVQGLRRDLMDASGLTYQAFDGTFRGSSPARFSDETPGSRTGEGHTSIVKQTHSADPGSSNPYLLFLSIVLLSLSLFMT
ncbi:hypothetical protein Tco_1221213 [Tanacetum coccineum]